MKSALSYLFKSENGGEVIDFLRSRGPQAHIIAPSWVREKVCGAEPHFSEARQARWSESLTDLGPVESEKINVIVIAEDAERERALALSLGRRKGVAVYGLFGHVVPALLCGAKGLSVGKPTEQLKRYAIICIPRSGSRYLSAVLSNLGVGAPREHIREPLAHIIAEGKLGFKPAIGALEKFGQKNGIFGTKLISTFLVRASRGRIAELRGNIAWMVERGYKLVRLERSLNEAVISSYIAFLMGQWHFFGEMNEAARAKLDALVFEDGAAWDEYLRFRSEQIIIDSIAASHGLPSVRYSDIETDVDGVVQRFCDEIGVSPSELAAGSARVPTATRTESPTYRLFAERLDALLDRRAKDIEAATVRKLRVLTGLGPLEAEAAFAASV